MRGLALALGAAWLLSGGMARAEVPAVMAYAGELTRADGTPEEGTWSIRFSLFLSALEESPFWDETHEVRLSAGRFVVLLGELEPLDPGTLDQPEVWLGVAVAGVPLEGRQRLVSAPYAVTSRDALHLAGLPVTSFARDTHTHAGTDVTGAVAACLDADTLDGLHAVDLARAAHEHAAESITAGSLGFARFSAYGDLVSEDAVGDGVDQVAPGLHLHDDAYLSLNGGAVAGPVSVSSLEVTQDGRAQVVLHATGRPARVLRSAEGDLQVIMDDGAEATQLVVKPSGRVGIGTTDPGVPLEVVGDVSLSGNLRVQGERVRSYVNCVDHDVGRATCDALCGCCPTGFTVQSRDCGPPFSEPHTFCTCLREY
jgi:hypothetical protein